ncbi:secondary thiamine-phosphate synthase enzyme YjbQ [Pseudogemmatithrix spongiicola]|uniref:Secondary thiamine-phosphate synthase enzyme YjbQ n=1 Tax=Pseudogemmatithrix spongiicola TaxID=3062599 RepID=A0AA49Q9G9_9BACT|nr:secondary thiamine-phosphate synthase enzyme YjbQ [Gemmatimonadaceae bacterium 'strain 138']WKW16290.1 secondary thiamine-phosphate synthase enzyme YjbQ [Gemmatimonadaceae bacterium 'strain 318']
MQLRRHSFDIRTESAIAFVDVTETVRSWVEAQGMANGLLTVSTPHTTARIVINERDAALQRDMIRHLQWFAPTDAAYEHNQHTVDGRNNAHAHLAALFMPASENVQVVHGTIQLGEWQALFFVELDGPRERREIHVQLLGE